MYMESTGLGHTGKKVEINFEFHRLNVLLLRRVVSKDGNQRAKKIATATAADARFAFTTGKTLVDKL